MGLGWGNPVGMRRNPASGTSIFDWESWKTFGERSSFKKLLLISIATGMNSCGKGGGVGMFPRIAEVFISIVLVLSVGSGWACAAFPSGAWKSSCQKSKTLDPAAGPLRSKPCKLFPCRTDKDRLFVFTLPDSASWRAEKEDHGGPKAYGTSGILPARRPYFCRAQSGAHPFDFLPDSAPPYFILNCSFLC